MIINTRTSVLIVLACGFGCGHPQRGGGGGGGDHGGGGGPIPVAVRKTADAMLGANAKLTAERERGTMIYEAAIRTKLEIELSETGQLLQTEIAVPIAALPTAVAAAASAKGKIGEADIVITPTGVVFEVEVGDVEYTIDAAGTILEQQHEAEGDEHGDNDDEDDDDKD